MPNHQLNGQGASIPKVASCASCDEVRRTLRRKVRDVSEQRDALQARQYQLVNEINVMRTTIRGIIEACDEDSGSVEATDKDYPAFKALRHRVSEDLKP